MLSETTTPKPCRVCGKTDVIFNPSRAKKHDWICSGCQNKQLNTLSTPVRKKAARWLARGIRRGAINMPSNLSVYLGFAQIAIDSGEPLELDHRIPIAQGGCGCVANVQLLTRAEHALKTKNEFKMPKETK